VTPTRTRHPLFADEDEARSFVVDAGLGWLGARLRYFETADSTNSRARRLATLDWPTGTVVLAEHQTAGRGRLGRRWVCPARAGLLVSALVPSVCDERGGALSPWLTAAGALAMVAAIERVCARNAKIEWPNDIVVEHADAPHDLRKVGGVLVEPTTSPDVAVLGVGLNVDVTPDEFPAELRAVASSLVGAFDAPVDRRALFGAFLRELESRLDRPEELGDELRRRTATVGRQLETDSLRGTAVAIDDKMRLVIESPDGTRDTLPFRTMGESA